MAMQEMITKSSEETTALGEKILKKALAGAEKERPLIFYLTGELGAGKTYFTKGIAKALGITAITSPTFVLIKKFKLPGSNPKRLKQYFFHIDCYRLYDAEDARQIGLDKVLQNPRAIIAIEWAERIAEIVPKPYWKVEFAYIKEGKRKIGISYIEQK